VHPALIFACIYPDPDVSFLFRWCGVRRSPYLITKFRRRVYPVDLICSDSPRVYLSTNPWKVTSTIQTISSTRDEYAALVEKLKASAPRKAKLKTEFAHQNLTSVLEGRLEVIDKELAVRFLVNHSTSRLLVVARHFCIASFIVFSFFFCWFFFTVRLTRVSSEYNVRAKRLSNATCFLLRPKSGKRVRGGRPTGLIMFTTASKIAT
jgi:hypothetical protein